MLVRSFCWKKKKQQFLELKTNRNQTTISNENLPIGHNFSTLNKISTLVDLNCLFINLYRNIWYHQRQRIVIDGGWRIDRIRFPWDQMTFNPRKTTLWILTFNFPRCVILKEKTFYEIMLAMNFMPFLMNFNLQLYQATPKNRAFDCSGYSKEWT